MKREEMLDIFRAALVAVDPFAAVRNAVRMQNKKLYAGGEVYDIDRYQTVLVIGAGKATARMALAVEECLNSEITADLSSVKEGHATPLRIIEQVEASHPLPNNSGLLATKRILDLVRKADEKTLIICLLSGGASALLVQPLPGLSLEEKQKTTDLLLRAGAPIEELNAVRKHLSGVKGGRLAQSAYPATILTLILSDVIGDKVDVIASGPTAPDGSTFLDAVAAIDKYAVWERLPSRVKDLIDRGVKGEESETAKSGDRSFEKTRNLIIGSLDLALAAALRKAVESGYRPQIVTAELQGEAREAARMLAGIARTKRFSSARGDRWCLLSGGETIVTVHGNGAGGRNQEFALAFALAIEGVPGISLLSAGTDGTDGPTDAAGAVVDGDTAQKARKLGIDPEFYLERNDSYTFFKRLDSVTGKKSHIVIGPTGTNVMDLQIICIEK